MPMGAGQLDRRVTLNKYQGQATGSDGNVADSWTFLSYAWANYKPVRGQELVKGGEWSGDSWVTFTIRYRADLAVKDQIVFNGTAYDIQDTNVEGERNEFLQVLTKARRV